MTVILIVAILTSMNFRRISHTFLIMLNAGVLLGSLAACGLFTQNAASGNPPTPTQIIPTAVDTPEPATPEQPLKPPVQDQARRLTIWMIPDISPRSEVVGGDLLTQQLETFDANHPDVQLFVELKAATGLGSIVSYLQAGRTVAPSILPDLVLIPTSQIREAASADLLYPLDDLLPEDMQADLFPVSHSLGQVNGELFAYPYALTGVHHAAYNTTAITETLPSSWTGLFGLPYTFAFPASSADGTRLLLRFYLAEGGALLDGANQPTLEQEPLVRALQHFALAKQNGLLVPTNATPSDISDAWKLLVAGQAQIVQTTPAQFSSERTKYPNITFAAIPGPDGPLPPLVNGWGWAISTPDAAQQALAAEMLAWLANGPNLGDWTLQTQYLPTRRAAFARWPSDGYVTFLEAELERAQPYPAVVDGRITTALSTALNAIMNGSLTPEAAAQQAIDLVKQ